MERLSHYRAWSDARVFGKALAACGGAMIEKVSPQAYAREKLMGDDLHEVTANLDAMMVAKAAIGGVDYGTSSDTPAWSSIAQGVYDTTVLGQLGGALRVAFVHKLVAGAILGVGAEWRKGSRAVRVAPISFTSIALAERGVSAIAVVTQEFAEFAVRDGLAADMLSRLMRDAIRRCVDAVFCSNSAAVANQTPAGLAHAAQTVASTGATAATISADVRSMVDAMVGGGVSLRAGATWVLSSEAYALLATLKVLDQSGVTLAGRPIVTDAPSGTFLLVAQEFLSYARSDAVQIVASTEGMVEMDSAPTGDAATPTAASASPISLFQSDAVALRASLPVNWQVSGPSDSSGNVYSVVALTGSAYA